MASNLNLFNCYIIYICIFVVCLYCFLLNFSLIAKAKTLMEFIEINVSGIWEHASISNVIRMVWLTEASMNVGVAIT